MQISFFHLPGFILHYVSRVFASENQWVYYQVTEDKSEY